MNKEPKGEAYFHINFLDYPTTNDNNKSKFEKYFLEYNPQDWKVGSGGGHLWPGQPSKTVFPQRWNADKVIHEVGDITTSPNTKWYAQTGTGGEYTKAGDPARWVSYETRDGVRIRVVYEPATDKVITAFPDNKPMPNYKPIE